MKARETLSAVSAFLLVITLSMPAHAIRLDFESGGMEFNGDVLTNVTDSLALDVVLSEILPEGVASFSFDITYDTSEVSLSSYAPNTSLPDPLTSELFGAADLTTRGFIGNVNGGSFLGKTDVDSFIIGTLNFLVEGLQDDGRPDFEFGFRAGQGISDGTTDLAVSALAGANLVAIPEPTSLILMGTGLVGFVRLARKRS